MKKRKRPLKSRTCRYCFQPFRPNRSVQRFCGRSCSFRYLRASNFSLFLEVGGRP